MPDQPTADLRTLDTEARRAFWPIVEAAFPDASLRQVLDAGQLAAINRALYAVRAAVLSAHRATVLADLGDPEPCPLDHSCEEDGPCGCWCDLHDCAIAECPTFKTVEAWIAGMHEKHEQAMANVRAMVLAEAAEAIERIRGSVDPDASIARDVLGHAAAHLRRLAATGPTTGPASTSPAQDGPAVPEEPDAHGGAQGDCEACGGSGVCGTCRGGSTGEPGQSCIACDNTHCCPVCNAGEGRQLHARLDAACRALAAEQAVRWSYDQTLDPQRLAAYIDERAASENVRADVEFLLRIADCGHDLEAFDRQAAELAQARADVGALHGTALAYHAEILELRNARKQRDEVIAERNEARADIERLTAHSAQLNQVGLRLAQALDLPEGDSVTANVDEMVESLCEETRTLGATVERLTRERDERAITLALSEQERLWNRKAYEQAKAERDQALDDLDATRDKLRIATGGYEAWMRSAGAAEADRDRLADTVRRSQPVIDAAKAWSDQLTDGPERSRADWDLAAAVDALGDAGQPLTEPSTAVPTPKADPKGGTGQTQDTGDDDGR